MIGRPCAPLFVVLGAALLTLASAAPAGTKTWTETPDTLILGEPEGVAVTEKGRLFLAPDVVPLGSLRECPRPERLRAGATCHAARKPSPGDSPRRDETTCPAHACPDDKPGRAPPPLAAPLPQGKRCSTLDCSLARGWTRR